MLVHIGCDLCGADNTRPIFTATDTNYHFPGSFSIVRCCECGLVYLNPRPDNQSMMAYYPDEEYTCFRSAPQVSALSEFHPTIMAAKTAGLQVNRLCDIGCGSGAFLRSVQLAGIEVAGIEPSDFARSRSSHLVGNNTVFPSFIAAGFDSESFDVVTMWHSFEHVLSPTNTLAEIYRVLRRRGILSLAVPNFDSFERRLFGSAWNAVDAPRHLYHFTKPVLEELLERCGFSILGFQQSPGAISLASNILRKGRSLQRSTSELQSKDAASKKAGPSVVKRKYLIGSNLAFLAEESRKEQARKYLSRIVYPASWLFSRVGYGPELMVHAIKR